MKNVLFILGTRPEAIKLAPLIKVFKQDKGFITKVCVTAQHRQMLDQVMDFFRIKPDYDLELMKPNQGILQFMANAILKLEPVFDEFKPDVVFVQGDTTTVLAGSLVAFHKTARIAHIEAGLRSHNKLSPFPEEINRIITSHLSSWHFAPTQIAIDNLKKEGITENVYLVGNTVIDALKMGIAEVTAHEKEFLSYFPSIDFSKRIMLVTCHRRESFGAPFVQICEALLHLAEEYKDIEIVYPVHLNPNIKEVAHKLLIHNNIKLISPLEYPQLIWLMNKSFIVLTDSGGIQEEAPSLGKPVLVMRDVTERMEGVVAGTAKLVGTDKQRIIDECSKLLEDKKAYAEMANAVNPYGDGTTSLQILGKVKEALN